MGRVAIPGQIYHVKTVVYIAANAGMDRPWPSKVKRKRTGKDDREGDCLTHKVGLLQ